MLPSTTLLAALGMSNGALVQGATVGPLGNGTLGFLDLLMAAAVFVRHLGAHLWRISGRSFHKS